MTKKTGEKFTQLKMFYSGPELRNKIKSLREDRHTFELTFTGYTANIKDFTDKKNYLFVKSSIRPAFELTAKIKKDIKASNIYVDKMHSSRIKYFAVNGLRDCKHKRVYNIDLNNAYPTSLKKLGFITEQTFNELEKVEKIKKLRAVGQIATRKSFYKFIDGEQSGPARIIEDEDFRAVWFAICFDVGETIDLVRRKMSSFLFFWFDGIYFTDITEAQAAIELIEQNGYKCKLETLTNFVVQSDWKNIYIKYKKKDGEKTFCLPKTEKLIYT